MASPSLSIIAPNTTPSSPSPSSAAAAAAAAAAALTSLSQVSYKKNTTLPGRSLSSSLSIHHFDTGHLQLRKVVCSPFFEKIPSLWHRWAFKTKSMVAFESLALLFRWAMLPLVLPVVEVLVPLLPSHHTSSHTHTYSSGSQTRQTTSAQVSGTVWTVSLNKAIQLQIDYLLFGLFHKTHWNKRHGKLLSVITLSFLYQSLWYLLLPFQG